MQNAKCKMFFSSGLADPGEMWYNNLIAECVILGPLPEGAVSEADWGSVR